MKRYHYLFLAIAIFLLLLLVGGLSLQLFLGSDACRRWMSKRLDNSLRTQGELQDISFNGSTFRASRYTGTGKPGTQIASIDTAKLSANFSFLPIFSGVLSFDPVEIEKADLTLGSPKVVPSSSPSPSAATGTTTPVASATPASIDRGSKLFDFRVDHVQIDDANLHWKSEAAKAGEVVGTKITAARAGDRAWNVAAAGGSVQLPFLPRLSFLDGSAVVSDRLISVKQTRMSDSAGGSLTITGEIPLEIGQATQLHGEFAAVPVQSLYSDQWHLEGIFSGSLQYTGSLLKNDPGEIRGTLHLQKAKIDWSHLLGKMKVLLDKLGMNGWGLDTVDVNLSVKGQHVAFSDLVARYQSQLRLEGSGTIEGGQLNAKIQIGLPAALFAVSPNVQKKVFAEQRDGLCWAEMQVTGTLDSPKEDLSGRVLAAVKDQLSNPLKNAAKSLLDLIH